MNAALGSFGRIFGPAPHAIAPDAAVELLKSGRAQPGAMLAFGNGRSYGDTCLNREGELVDMRRRAGIVSLDAEGGVLVAEAGTMLSDIIAAAAPHGFFPAVVPGTQHVTLGGAIANDIHGKNHHVAGTFGCHVLWLDLLRSDGRLRRCSADEDRELFAATIGGMGLTGLILTAAIRLKRVGSPDVLEVRKPFRNIAHYLELAAEADAANEYAVAWIDQLAGGSAAGQGVLLCGNHAEAGRRSSARAAPARLGVPFAPPFTVLNRPAIRAFNAAYGWAKRRAAPAAPTGWRSYFFPLDGVRDWNRLYGPRGLFQHQSVVPFEAAAEALPRMLAATRRAGQASFLTVLKRFGPVRSPGLLSFPRPGYTLTLDFPNRGEETLRLLAELDAVAVGAGGAVNPYKDARMPPSVFESSFPNWHELEAQRDPAFLSDFWRRTALRVNATGTRLANLVEQTATPAADVPIWNTKL